MRNYLIVQPHTHTHTHARAHTHTWSGLSAGVFRVLLGLLLALHFFLSFFPSMAFETRLRLGSTCFAFCVRRTLRMSLRCCCCCCCCCLFAMGNCWLNLHFKHCRSKRSKLAANRLINKHCSPLRIRSTSTPAPFVRDSDSDSVYGSDSYLWQQQQMQLNCLLLLLRNCTRQCQAATLPLPLPPVSQLYIGACGHMHLDIIGSR